MTKRRYAVMGATGQIGHVVAAELLKHKHEVIALGRDPKRLAALQAKGAKTLTADVTNIAQLARAFADVDGVFAMIAPSYGELDHGAYQDRAGEAIFEALKQTNVRNIVNLSSLGAQLADGTGPIKGLSRQERRLDALTDANILNLRAAYFMQNFNWSIPTIQQQGIIVSSLKGDLPVWMVSTDDIGRKVAELLEGLRFKGHSAFEFVGPRQITMNEAATIISKVVGKTIRYVQVPYEEQRKTMIEHGMNESISGLFIEMYRALNEGKVAPTQKLDSDHHGKTTFEGFAKSFAGVYRHAA